MIEPGLIASLSFIVRTFDAEDIIVALSTAFADQSGDYARRTGDYDRAGKMRLVAEFLDTLDDYLENYDGAPND